MIIGVIFALGLWAIVLLFVAAVMFKLCKKIFKWMIK